MEDKKSARETAGGAPEPSPQPAEPDRTAADRPDPGQMEFGRIVAERDKELDQAKKRH